MKKIKEFCKKHKKELIFTGCLAGAVVIGILAKGKPKRHYLVQDVTGKSVLTWKPCNSSMNLERVKEILDLNANNSSSFAIFREGPDPNAYACILISDDVITNKLV